MRTYCNLRLCLNSCVEKSSERHTPQSGRIHFDTATGEQSKIGPTKFKKFLIMRTSICTTSRIHPHFTHFGINNFTTLTCLQDMQINRTQIILHLCIIKFDKLGFKNERLRDNGKTELLLTYTPSRTRQVQLFRLALASWAFRSLLSHQQEYKCESPLGVTSTSQIDNRLFLKLFGQCKYTFNHHRLPPMPIMKLNTTDCVELAIAQLPEAAAKISTLRLVQWKVAKNAYKQTRCIEMPGCQLSVPMKHMDKQRQWSTNRVGQRATARILKGIAIAICN